MHEIYEFNSNSWRVLDVTPDWYIAYYYYGVSLEGNMYWQATYKNFGAEIHDFLICFDFTKEKFGPHLPLPFESSYDVVTLSTFGEEQLAVLVQPFCSYGMEIWVTNKIEPNAVSWSKFLAIVDMGVLIEPSFLIHKEKQAVVVFDEHGDLVNHRCDIAYIVGENGYFRQMDLG